MSFKNGAYNVNKGSETVLSNKAGDALEKIEPDRQLYLAVRVPIYESFFQRRFIAAAVERYQLRLVTYVQQEVIIRWL